MKTLNQHYEAPQVEIIDIEIQGELCVSGGPSTSKGAGTSSMGMSAIDEYWHG